MTHSVRPSHTRHPSRLKGIALAVLATVAVGLFAGGGVLSVYALRSLPQLDGQQVLPGLQGQVTVQRDAADVTHIRAQTRLDAFRALGMVHAQERAWQLELNRRVMHGRLSEVFGPAALSTDQLLLTLGIRQAAKAQFDALPSDAKQALQTYAEGINSFLAHTAQPAAPEFKLLGIDPKATAQQGQFWTAEDCVGWALMMALDLGGNWGNEWARLSALQVLDTPQLWALMPAYPGEAPATAIDLAALYRSLGVFAPPGEADAPAKVATTSAPSATTGLAADLVAWTDRLGNVEGKGSNNWVVSGRRTESGLPLLANDPHLGLSAPAIWYFARLQAPGRTDSEASDAQRRPLDVMGATLPGLPMVILGRTRQVAWGFTNTGPDVQDLYLEQINPDNPHQYRVPGTTDQPVWADFEVREERIPVKGQGEVIQRVRSTRHGPVLTDAQAFHAKVIDTRRYVLSLRWSALDADNHTVLAGLEGATAQSVDELLHAYRHYHSPMQNVVVADVQGRVAYKAAGKVPVRAPNNDLKGMAPAPGWEPRYDWAGWLPYAQTPEAHLAPPSAPSHDAANSVPNEAPAAVVSGQPGTGQALGADQGWLATANQRIHGADFPAFLTQDWASPDREDRIQQLLRSRERHSPDSLGRIQGDVLSLATVRLLPALRAAQPQHPLGARALALLKDFDGTMAANQAAPLIFAAWVDALTRLTIGQKLGEAKFNSLYGKRQFRDAVEGLLARNDRFWCGEAGCPAQVSRALDLALADLQARYGANVERWQWGRAHPAVSKHQPFSNVAPLASLFEVRVPTGGDTFTVNVGRYNLDQPSLPFANRHAASLRALYDLSNLDNSRFIYQTGQSGNPFDPRYRDMANTWAQGGYRPLKMDGQTFVHTLTLSAH
ncbi:MAG TPA: penicillin acylase family protein [Burkholderiaceae bacterium]|nr:penicillin acylase family protein [Burkholderiaceae bacterium]